jgi:hypothetical protein
MDVWVTARHGRVGHGEAWTCGSWCRSRRGVARFSPWSPVAAHLSRTAWRRGSSSAVMKYVGLYWDQSPALLRSSAPSFTAPSSSAPSSDMAPLSHPLCAMRSSAPPTVFSRPLRHPWLRPHLLPLPCRSTFLSLSSHLRALSHSLPTSLPQ